MSPRTCDQCHKHLVTHRSDARFCDEICRTRWKNERRRKQDGPDTRVNGQSSGEGSRGGNVRSVREARDLQAQTKDKRDWSGAIDEQIRLKLVGTATVHANDLDGLDVPAEHRNLIGTRMARYANKGWMEATTERRKVTHPAANGRRNPVYRITRKGWRELAGVSAGTRGDGHGGPVEHNAEVSRSTSAPPASADPGEPQRPTGAPSPKGSDRATNPPVPSASEKTGESSAVTSHAVGDSTQTLSLLPDVDPEAWAA